MATRLWSQKLSRLVRGWTDVNLLEVLPLLTVLMLLTTAPDIWYLRTPLLILSITGLVFRRVLQTPQFWYLAATLIGTTIYLNWESTDNHKYLVGYWCLALCSAYSLPRGEQQKALHLTSRWLLGLCMLLAALWKITTSDYMSGAFFQYTLLVDERFEYPARWAGQLTATMLADNRQLHDLLRTGYLRGLEMNTIQLASSAPIVSVAWLLTWWTVLIEGVAGILFLLPDRRWTSWSRNTVLLTFAVTTYAVATVRGFGWMLMLLGLAQTTESQRRFRVSFVVVFLLIQVYTLPLAPVAGWVGNLLTQQQSCCPMEPDSSMASGSDRP